MSRSKTVPIFPTPTSSPLRSSKTSKPLSPNLRKSRLTLNEIDEHVKPSFYTLYKQGRFRGSAVDNASDDRMQQVERFAVAMVGFALKYDEDFCRQFCRTICEVSVENAILPIPVDVEVDGFGDLELQVGPRHFFIEFKIEA